MSNANGADGPPISLTLIVPHQGTEKDFIKAAVRAARIHARASWRARNGHVVHKGGRPSLKQAVGAACAAQWELWGRKFPRNSTMGDLVQKVSARLPVTHCGQPPERRNLRIITKHVNSWTNSNLYVFQLPRSWFTKTLTGRSVMKVVAEIQVIPKMCAALAAHLKQRADQELAPSTTPRKVT